VNATDARNYTKKTICAANFPSERWTKTARKSANNTDAVFVNCH
jgi:hypothetical protein